MISVGLEAEFPSQDSIMVSRGWGNRVSLIRLQFTSMEGAGFQLFFFRYRECGRPYILGKGGLLEYWIYVHMNYSVHLFAENKFPFSV